MHLTAWPAVAIPSYRRPVILRERTLTTLARLGVPARRITIFVADQDQAADYDRTLDPRSYGSLVIAQPGMGAVRRYIQSYYAEGAKVLNIDDDIGGLYRKETDKRYIRMEAGDLDMMVRMGLWACREAHARLWGIYPVLNALFMKKRINVGLTYIVGALWGCINTREPEMAVTLDDKEDFERTMKLYLADGAVVRLEAYSLRTSYYSTPGGMQETRTATRIDTSARILAERYPELCTLNLKKKSGHTEIRLRRHPKTVLA